ncbi:DNA-directed DNA polymerase [Tanacetum coccineum]|uniref:DNA-directed DNA polymerase n=1 Tax=Tanacetum coccineum TaxID=301880 RepID=A0ABQ4ZD10_9ASTR
MYHDLYLGEKALVERENLGFDLTKSDMYPSFIKDLTAKGVGLHVVGSHTGNHREDDFTPLESIRRFLDVIGSRSLSSSKGMPSSQRGGNMDSSMGKMCLGKDVIEIFSDRNKGPGDWDSPEYKDTAGSGGKKEPKALVFHKITLKRKVIEDEFEPGLIFGRSFLRSANAIVNFEEGIITIQPAFDPFLLSSNEEGNPNLDNLEELLDFDFDEAPQTKTDLLQLVCKIGKGSRNKKIIMENIMYFNNSVGPSTSVGTPLTQEEAERRVLAHSISMRKLLDEIWADKIKLDGKIKLEEERAMVKVKGQMLKEKKDPGAFLFLIRLEGLINENALADTGSDTNTMPYRIYEQLGRDDIMQEERNIPMINYTEAEVTSRLVNVLCQVGFTTLYAQFLILKIPIDRDTPIMVGHRFLDTIGSNIDIPNRILTTFDGVTRQTFRAARSEKIRTAKSDLDDEEDYVIKRNDMGTPIYNSKPIGYQNNTNPAKNMTLSTLDSVINPFRKISVWKKAEMRVLYEGKQDCAGAQSCHAVDFGHNDWHPSYTRGGCFKATGAISPVFNPSELWEEV